MVQMEDVESEAEQQPFGGDLRTAAKQKTPEIKILLHICKVAFGLNGTVHPKQAALWEEIFASIACRCSAKRFDT